MSKKEQESTDVFSSEMGAILSQSAGAGFETVRPDDIATPFLTILQSNSPELVEDDPKCILGAKQGMIINTLTRKIIGGRGEPVLFIPCAYKKLWVEWKPREMGGGVVRVHDTEKILGDTTKDPKSSKDILPSGNVIVTTVYMFGILQTEDGKSNAVISFTSTQLKKARSWMSQMFSMKMKRADGTSFMPPIWSHEYNLSSVPEKNDKGSWYGWKIELKGLIDKELVEAAKTTMKLASAPVTRQLSAHEEEF